MNTASNVTVISTHTINTKKEHTQVLELASRRIEFPEGNKGFVKISSPQNMEADFDGTILHGIFNPNQRVGVEISKGNVIEVPQVRFIGPIEIYGEDGETQWVIQVPAWVYDLEGIRRGILDNSITRQNLLSFKLSAVDELKRTIQKYVMRGRVSPGSHSVTIVGNHFLEMYETAISEEAAKDWAYQILSRCDEWEGNTKEVFDTLVKRVSTTAAASMLSIRKRLREAVRSWNVDSIPFHERGELRENIIKTLADEALYYSMATAMDGMACQVVRHPSTDVPEQTLRVIRGMKEKVFFLHTEIQKFRLLGDNDGDLQFNILRGKVLDQSQNIEYKINLEVLVDMLPDIGGFDISKSLKHWVKDPETEKENNGDPIQILIGMEMRQVTGIFTYHAWNMCRIATIRLMQKIGTLHVDQITEIYVKYLRIFSYILESVMDGWKMSDTRKGARLITDLLNFFSGKSNLPEEAIRDAFEEAGWEDDIEPTLEFLRELLTFNRNKNGVLDMYSPTMGIEAHPVWGALVQRRNNPDAMMNMVNELNRRSRATGKSFSDMIEDDLMCQKEVIVDKESQQTSQSWKPRGRALVPVLAEDIQLKGSCEPLDLTDFGGRNQAENMELALEWAVREYLPTLGLVPSKISGQTPEMAYGFTSKGRLWINMPHRHTKQETAYIDLPSIVYLHDKYYPQETKYRAKQVKVKSGRFLARPRLTNIAWRDPRLFSASASGNIHGEGSSIVRMVSSDRVDKDGNKYSPWVVLGAEALIAMSIVDCWANLWKNDGKSVRWQTGQGKFRIAINERISHFERMENAASVLTHSNEIQCDWPGKGQVPSHLEWQYDAELATKILIARQLQRMGYDPITNSKSDTLQVCQPKTEGWNHLFSSISPLGVAGVHQRYRELRNLGHAALYVEPSVPRLVTNVEMPQSILNRTNEEFVIYANVLPLVIIDGDGKITSPDQFAKFKSSDRIKFLTDKIVYNGPRTGKTLQEWQEEFGPNVEITEEDILTGGYWTPREKVVVVTEMSAYGYRKAVTNCALKGITMPIPEDTQWYAKVGNEVIPVDMIIPAQSIVDKSMFNALIDNCMRTLATPENPWVVPHNMSVETLKTEIIPELEHRLLEAGRINEHGKVTMRIPVYASPECTEESLIGWFHGGWSPIYYMPHGDMDYRANPVKVNLHLNMLLGYGIRIPKSTKREINTWADIIYKAGIGMFGMPSDNPEPENQDYDINHEWDDSDIPIMGSDFGNGNYYGYDDGHASY